MMFSTQNKTPSNVAGPHLLYSTHINCKTIVLCSRHSAGFGGFKAKDLQRIQSRLGLQIIIDYSEETIQ